MTDPRNLIITVHDAEGNPVSLVEVGPSADNLQINPEISTFVLATLNFIDTGVVTQELIELSQKYTIFSEDIPSMPLPPLPPDWPVAK